MSNLKKLAVALIAAAFCAATPAIAADMPATAPAQPDLGGVMKEKATGMMKDKASQVIDQGKQNLEKSLGIQKNATQPKTEVLDVNQETVTVETPQGAASETTTTITPATPEAPAAPAAPEAPASK
ncbi:MAG: hypothetical protein HDQ44_00590 [Desulfovibrio sp.]|nr:hypothetical protein [Desulfovibrio sp.]